MSFFITLLLYAALFVLSDLLTPKPDLEDAKPAGLGDFRFPTATEQRKLPLVFGTVQISGPNVVWWGDLVQEAIRKKVKTGLFSSTTQIIGFRYHIGTQEALCEGPIDDLLRVWLDEDRLVRDPVDGADVPIEHEDTFTIDEPELYGGEELGQGGFEGTFMLHAGEELQNVSTYLSAFQKFPPDTGDTPAYRWTCYIAPATTRTYVGNSTSVSARKWEVRRCPNGLGVGSGQHQVNDYDANPVCVLFEAMTSTRWGQAIDSADIDTANFIDAAETCFAEGNGFSMLIDREENVADLIRRLEQQIDGVVFLNPFTGKWQVKLARADYDIDDLLEISPSVGISEVVDWTQGTWEDTKNQVTTPFNDREDQYKGTYGFAQDMANVRIVGKLTPTEIAHPGVKNKALAQALAWRGLRTLSRPLRKGTIVCSREVYGQLPGYVVAVTHPTLNVDRLPMRIRSIDYGDLLNGAIRLSLVEDIFFAGAGSFEPPPPSGWETPTDELAAIPADEQIAFEAPRAFTVRDPETTDPGVAKIFAAARRQGSEVSFRIRERHSSGTPAGSFSLAGEVISFVHIGELLSSINEDSAYPLTSLTIVPTPSTQDDVLAAFEEDRSLQDLGQELSNLCYCEGEFMLVSSASPSGGNVALANVYRGALDSAQRPHSSGAQVYLIFAGGGLTDTSFPHGNNVDVKLTPRSLSDEVAEGSATTIAIALASLVKRPYPPSEFDLNGTRLDRTNVDLDGSGSGENFGVLFDAINRRDFRTLDEVASLLADAGSLAADFPTANTTTHRLVVKNGVAVLVNQSIGAATSGTVRQLDILQALGTTSLPSSLTFGVGATHVYQGSSFDSVLDCQVIATVASDLVGKFAFGALDTNQDSANYVVVTGDDTVDHDFTLSSAFTLGDVEYRINGGAWTTLILSGLTTGSIPNAAIVVGDTIEIRHTSSDVGAQKLCTMTVGANTRAYGVLYT